ncbi:MAG: hypothetical protein KKA73_09060 [Chloroflexi bacterium]|nr:hypothetical protein [Chloroflexota bacterium]MBU1747827.1 hypothetical protein [Chloroflexota bacterium]
MPQATANRLLKAYEEELITRDELRDNLALIALRNLVCDGDAAATMPLAQGLRRAIDVQECQNLANLAGPLD